MLELVIGLLISLSFIIVGGLDPLLLLVKSRKKAMSMNKES